MLYPCGHEAHGMTDKEAFDRGPFVPGGARQKSVSLFFFSRMSVESDGASASPFHGLSRHARGHEAEELGTAASRNRWASRFVSSDGGDMFET